MGIGFQGGHGGSSSGGGDGAVASVNGKVGAVELTAEDVGARDDEWFPTPAEIGTLSGSEINDLVDSVGGTEYTTEGGSLVEDSLINSRSVLIVAVGTASSPGISGQPVDPLAGNNEAILSSTDVGNYKAADARTVVRVVSSSAGASGNIMLLLRARGSNAQDALGFYFSGASNEGLYLFARDSGAWGSALANTTIAPATPGGAPRWLSFEAVGNVLTGEVWDSDPDQPGATRIAVVTHTLTGANATKHGANVSGRGGVRWGGNFAGTKFLSYWRWVSKDPLPAKPLKRIEKSLSGILTGVLEDDSRVRLTKDLGNSFPTPKRVSVSDVAYTCDGTEDIVAYTSLTAARTVTLPSAASYPPGKVLTVKDESGSAFNFTRFISVTAPSSGAIDGLAQSLGILGRNGSLQFYSNGTSWFTVGRLPEGRSVYSSSATLAPSDRIVTYTGSGGTLTLPTPGSVAVGTRILVKKLNVSSNVTVAGTIDGATNYVLAAADPYGWVEVFSSGSNWEIANSSAARLPSRTSGSFSTASLAADASATGTATLAKSLRVLSIATNRPARIRFYATAALRDADASRPLGTDPTGNHGLFLEVVTSTGQLTQILSPQVDISNMESSPSSSIPYTVTNLDASAGVVTTSITYISTED